MTMAFYVVREPLGSVIGVSKFSASRALDDADLMCDIPRSVYVQLQKGAVETPNTTYRGYTLKVENLASYD